MTHKFVLIFATRYNGLYLQDKNTKINSEINNTANNIVDRLELCGLTRDWVGEDDRGDWDDDSARDLSTDCQNTLINLIKNDSEFKEKFGSQEIEFEFDHHSS